MSPNVSILIGLLAMALTPWTAGCGGDPQTSTPTGTGGSGGGGGGGGAGGGGAGGGSATTTDDVVEIAIRRLNDGQDVMAFETARDAFVELLRKQDGVGTDREFQAVFDFTVNGPPVPSVYIGMTQYDTLGAFQAAGEALGSTPEAGAFFSTFKPEAFTVLRPLEEGSEVNLAGIASSKGNILEVAVRDLSKYQGFDAAAYASTRDAFLTLLKGQPGVVAEYQWVSALDPNVVVGMTVYQDQPAFQAIGMDPAVVGSPEAMEFLSKYPPVVGYVNVVVR